MINEKFISIVCLNGRIEKYDKLFSHKISIYLYYLRDVFNTNIINILSSNLILKTIKPSKYKLEGIASE